MLRRTLTRRQLAIAIALQLVVALVLRHVQPPHVDGVVDVQGAFFFALISVMWDAVGWFLSASEAVLGAIVSALSSAVAWLSDYVFKGIASAGGFFQGVFGAVTDLWNDVLKPAFSTLWDWFKEIHDDLVDWFGPIVKGLTSVAKAIRTVYSDWLKPILDVIDITKQVLDVAAAVGIDAAKSVEQKLNDFEVTITQPILYLSGKINELLGFIQNIIDENGVFQRITLIKSMVTYKGSVVNAFSNAMTKKLTPDQQAAYAQQPVDVTVDDFSGDLAKYFNGEPVTFGAAADEWAGDFELLIRS